VCVGSGEGHGPVGVGPGVGVGRGVGRGVGDGVGPGATAVTLRVDAFGDGEGLELGAAMGVLDADAPERIAAQESRPHKAVCAVCARGRAAAGGLRNARNAPEPPTTISAAAHGARYRARRGSRECGWPLRGDSAELDGSSKKLDGPVGIRPPSWTAKCYQMATTITAVMSAKRTGRFKTLLHNARTVSSAH
jgi:hypothetical protein